MIFCGLHLMAQIPSAVSKVDSAEEKLAAIQLA
jgi:hypothetical protein